MKPSNGRNRITSTQITFLPVVAVEPITEISAQMSSASRMNPPMPVSSDACVSSRCGGVRATRRSPFQCQARTRSRVVRAIRTGSLSNRPASCSVIAPASCSTSVMVTARP